VFISGALHGNERLGPAVTFYLIEYLVTNYGKDPLVSSLLSHIELVIIPMTNAVGYSRNERLEAFNGTKGYDINRDFPYNQDP